MFIRFLRIGFRVSLLGNSLSWGVSFSCLSTPQEKTTGRILSSLITLRWHMLVRTVVRYWAGAWYWVVSSSSPAMHELYKEWNLDASKRYHFLAYGDVDMKRDYRCAVVVEENIPTELCCNQSSREHLQNLCLPRQGATRQPHWR
jgi:hypothetical protein